MKKIDFLDLEAQHGPIRSQLNQALASVINSSQFINGPEVAAFARELETYTGARHAIPCGNGTDALQLALMALGIGPGDEVLLPAFTYIAPAEAVSLLGATPIFVDVEKDSFALHPQQLEQHITPKTKVIIAVHLFGLSAHMEPILQLAQKYQLKVIEDCAQSLGTYYRINQEEKSCGTLGDIGCLSFFPSKNLGAMGDGGALLTQNTELAERLKSLASHGQTQKYHHHRVGINSRLDSLQAAILRVKLPHLNQYIAGKQAIAAYYQQELAQLVPWLHLPVEKPYGNHSYHQYTLRVEAGKRDALQQFLHSKSIPSVVYYPLSLPQQVVYASDKQALARCPQAQELAQTVLSLPIHTGLDSQQLQYITQQIKAFYHG